MIYGIPAPGMIALALSTDDIARLREGWPIMLNTQQGDLRIALVSETDGISAPDALHRMMNALHGAQ